MDKADTYSNNYKQHNMKNQKNTQAYMRRNQLTVSSKGEITMALNYSENIKMSRTCFIIKGKINQKQRPIGKTGNSIGQYKFQAQITGKKMTIIKYRKEKKFCLGEDGVDAEQRLWVWKH